MTRAWGSDNWVKQRTAKICFHTTNYSLSPDLRRTVISESSAEPINNTLCPEKFVSFRASNDWLRSSSIFGALETLQFKVEWSFKIVLNLIERAEKSEKNSFAAGPTKGVQKVDVGGLESFWCWTFSPRCVFHSVSSSMHFILLATPPQIWGWTQSKRSAASSKNGNTICVNLTMLSANNLLEWFFCCPVTNGKMSQEMIHFPLIDLSGRSEFFNVSLDWTSNQLLEHRLD